MTVLRPAVTPPARAQTLVTRQFLLPKGAFIDCTLETAIDSTLPGMTTCVTATDTFGVDGKVVFGGWGADNQEVGEQQLGQRGPAPLHIRGGGLDLHPVLARPHARRGVGTGPGVHDAHAADPDRVIALIVAQHRDVDARGLGRVPNRGAVRNGDLLPVDG